MWDLFVNAKSMFLERQHGARWLLVTAVVVALAVGPEVSQATPLAADFCSPGAVPGFHFGFMELANTLGDAMGAPIACEHTESANGDMLQGTTTGLAFYRASTNTPTFTDGFNH
jgi:hypothetical protein